MCHCVSIMSSCVLVCVLHIVQLLSDYLLLSTQHWIQHSIYSVPLNLIQRFCLMEKKFKLTFWTQIRIEIEKRKEIKIQRWCSMGRKFKLTFSTRPAKKIMPPSETTISGFLYWQKWPVVVNFTKLRSGEGFLCVFSITEEDSFQVSISHRWYVSLSFILEAYSYYGQWLNDKILLLSFTPRQLKNSESRSWGWRGTTTSHSYW